MVSQVVDFCKAPRIGTSARGPRARAVKGGFLTAAWGACERPALRPVTPQVSTPPRPLVLKLLPNTCRWAGPDLRAHDCTGPLGLGDAGAGCTWYRADVVASQAHQADKC